MKIRKLVIASSIIGLGVASAPSASALGAGAAGGGGAISPTSGLGACATLSFSGGGTFVGQFVGVGELQGPGTQVGTVRGAIPIVVTSGSSWSGCIPGSYAGATAGEAKFTLSGNSKNGDYLAVVQCAVTNGHQTCV